MALWQFTNGKSAEALYGSYPVTALAEHVAQLVEESGQYHLTGVDADAATLRYRQSELVKVFFRLNNYFVN